MARFEMTISNGEKILVDHASAGMEEITRRIRRSGFLLFSEIKRSSSSAPSEVIVASGQITLIRPLDDQSRQNTDFRPKR